MQMHTFTSLSEEETAETLREEGIVLPMSTKCKWTKCTLHFRREPNKRPNNTRQSLPRPPENQNKPPRPLVPKFCENPREDVHVDIGYVTSLPLGSPRRHGSSRCVLFPRPLVTKNK